MFLEVPQPLKKWIFKFSEKYGVGSLNLYCKKPDSLQKELAQFDYPDLRKHPKCGWLAVLGQCQNIPIFWHILDVFSEQGTRIELIPFSMSQDT